MNSMHITIINQNQILSVHGPAWPYLEIILKRTWERSIRSAPLHTGSQNSWYRNEKGIHKCIIELKQRY
jgi:hypothetical protein